MAIRPFGFGTIAIVPYGNTARSSVYGTIAIVPYGNARPYDTGGCCQCFSTQSGGDFLAKISAPLTQSGADMIY
ncbi:MAG: hypothetical protein LBS10_03675 [Gracilibacteraceae bacterium]|jgi:hypothetical protein|nr:hypothetical protein [Gracilibacteraceae bacterium]